jgi:L-amino acid N-acyltransferase YncA
MRASFHSECVRSTVAIVADHAAASTRLFQRAARRVVGHEATAVAMLVDQPMGDVSKLRGEILGNEKDML